MTDPSPTLLVFCLILLTPGGLLGQTTPAGAHGIAPPALEADEARRIVLFRDELFAGRRALLATLRSEIRARHSGAAAATTAALTQGCQTAQAGFRQWIEQNGGRVTQQYWLIPGAAVEVPPTLLPALLHRPEVARVTDDTTYAGTLRICTDARNHNADRVHAVNGLRGTGVALALLDSGVDLDVPVAGNSVPHPAFDRLPPGQGSRIRKAIGLAVAGDHEDHNGHGSAVAAIALAIDWNGAFGFSDDGFAPDSELVSYKVTTGSNLTLLESTVVAAWQQACQDRLRYGIAVANHSFEGSPDPTSPAQQALDQAVFVGDILAVTSAGNDGQTASPTAVSQSCANGLAVGAITADAGQASPHKVTPFSSFGPLPNDGARWFPDLVACGDSVISVQINSPNGITFNPGTSFAAPMVAGTALLLRSAMPSYSALDTKAVLLNNVEDVSASNPSRTRSHYGLGMLRTDLAVDALSQGTLLRGQLDAQQAILSQSYTVAVQGQTPYAATLAWLRTDPTTMAWDDLDLHVVDPAGKTIAVSDSPRNLYERVLFEPTTTGSYTLTVLGNGLTTQGPLDFVLAFGPNQGGGRQPGSYQHYGSGCPGTAPDPAAGVVVPTAAAGTIGNARTRIPFSYLTTRLHQAYDRSAFPAPRTVQAIAFRRDEQQADSPGYDMGLEMWLGYTAKPPNGLAAKFVDNIASPLTQVVNFKTVRFPGTQGLPRDANQFDWIVPLDQPFTIDPPAGQHLLWETRVYWHTQGNQPFGLYFDAVQSATTGRVYTDGQPTGTVGFVDDLAIVSSFMTSGLSGITPNLQADGLPQLGQTFTPVLRHALAGTTAVLLHGGSRVAWGGVPLPFDLTGLGAGGCHALTDNLVAIPATVRADGTIEVPFPIPANPSLTGETFYHQFAVFDMAANSLGLVTTDAARALIGG